MSPRFRVVAFLRRPSGLAARHSSAARYAYAAAAPDDDSRARSFGAAIWRTRGEPVRRRRGPDGASIAGRAGGRRTNGSAKRNGRSRRRRVRLYSPPPPNDRRRPVFSLRFMFFLCFFTTHSLCHRHPSPAPAPPTSRRCVFVVVRFVSARDRRGVAKTRGASAGSEYARFGRYGAPDRQHYGRGAAVAARAGNDFSTRRPRTRRSSSPREHCPSLSARYSRRPI